MHDELSARETSKRNLASFEPDDEHSIFHDDTTRMHPPKQEGRGVDAGNDYEQRTKLRTGPRHSDNNHNYITMTMPPKKVQKRTP